MRFHLGLAIIMHSFMAALGCIGKVIAFPFGLPVWFVGVIAYWMGYRYEEHTEKGFYKWSPEA